MPKNSGLEKCREIAENFKDKNTEVISVRGEDIPFLVSTMAKEGKDVLGITGEDVFKEFILNRREPGVEILKRITWRDEKSLYGKPTLCLLGPEGKNLEELPKRLKVIINKKYEKIAKKYLSKIQDSEGMAFEKIYLSGSTEEMYAANISNLVIDIVYSGASAKRAGLKVYDKIFESDIVVIGKKENYNLIDKMDWEKMNGLIPTIVKDEQGNVLTLKYSNKESLRRTIETGNSWSYSRARKRIAMKGESSGDIQKIIDIKTDCDNDALLFTVKQKNNACHLNNYSCFNDSGEFTLESLYRVIGEKIKEQNKDSYTFSLCKDSKLLNSKIKEEAAELTLTKNKSQVIWESADLLYFVLVFLAKRQVTLKQIENKLKERNKNNQPLTKSKRKIK